MKNHGFILLFLLAIGLLYAQRPVDYAVSQENLIVQSLRPDLQSGEEGISYLAMGRDGSYFYVKDFFEGAFGKVYYRPSYTAGEVLIFDPESYAAGFDQVFTVKGLFPDHEARRLAITIAAENSELCDLVVIDLESQVVDNYLSGISSLSVSWLPDGEHILYHRWSSSNLNNEKYRLATKTWLHKLGTPEKEDLDYFSSRANPGLDILETEVPVAYYNRELDAVLGVVKTDNNTLKIYRQKGSILEPTHWEPLATEQDMVNDFCVTDRHMYYKTSKDAKNYKIVISDRRWPDVSNGEVLIPEFDDAVITELKANRDGLYFTTYKEGQARLWFRSLRKTRYEPVKLPYDARKLNIEIHDPNSGKLWINISGKDKIQMRYRFRTDQGTFIKQPLNRPIQVGSVHTPGFN